MPEKHIDQDTSVRVALRIRPQSAKEKIDMCRVCTSVTPGSAQVQLGPDRMFTYDFVFDLDSQQDAIYDSTVRSLIDGCFEGYNATVFAYGQTGSGKTYTMGTAFEPGITSEQEGIVPRAVHHLFAGIEERKCAAEENRDPPPEFKIHAQFMELYNEEVLDLFDAIRDVESSRNKKSHIKIHEDAQGGIYVVGVTTRTVTSEEETLQCLRMGALSRTTASTNMNAQSSRSHAIFTLHIKQQRVVKVNTSEEDQEGAPQVMDENEGMQEFETLTAKFHFVDLAGSERLKRTGATGDRAKEGISINCGLLALGNVISALGDPTKRSTHVPYRDSKLTRLLQDSLGGNSQTLMIACTSPSDRDFMETLNTLRYANRARNIKNVLSANQDKTSRQLGALRQEIRELQEELLDYKQGKRSVNAEGVEEINDLFHENTMLQTEINNLRQRVKAMQETIDAQTNRIAHLLAQEACAGLASTEDEEGEGSALSSMMEGYIKEVEMLRAKLVESESTNAALRRRATDSPIRMPSRASMSPTHIPLSASASHYKYEQDYDEDLRVLSIISEAKQQIVHDTEKLQEVERLGRQMSKTEEKESETKEPNNNETTATAPSKEQLTQEAEKDLEEAGKDEEGAGKDVKEADKDVEGAGKEVVNGVELAEEDEKEGDEVEDEDVDDDDDDESSSSDSENEEEGSTMLREDLADIACEINIKQKLIEELEMSQRRLHTLKAQYEQKLESLQARIKETEMERDQVINNLGSMAESRTQEKADKIRKEFEIKLKKLQDEKKRLKFASKEHQQLMRSRGQHERQINTLKTDLSSLKETKVKLMRQIKEDQAKNRQKDLARNREIQQIKKESMKQTSRIKTLEAEARQREIVLKRRREELQTLRKTKKPMTDKVAGRVTTSRPTSAGARKPDQQQQTTNQRTNSRPNKPLGRRQIGDQGARKAGKHERSGTSEYSSKAAKLKWSRVERKIGDIVLRRQTISHTEKDMERFMHHRHRLSKQLDKAIIRFEQATKDNATEDILSDLAHQIDGLRANIDYVQEQIQECQATIMETMEGKDDLDSADAAIIIDQCSLQEAKYMLQHFVMMGINISFERAQRDSQIKELNVRLHQIEQQERFQRDLLEHVMGEGQIDLELDGFFGIPEAEESSSSAESSRAPSPSEAEPHVVQNGVNVASSKRVPLLPSDSQPATNGPSHIPQPSRSRDKARRRTATQEELLYVGTGAGEGPALFSVQEEDELELTTFADQLESQAAQRLEKGMSQKVDPSPQYNGSALISKRQHNFLVKRLQRSKGRSSSPEIGGPTTPTLTPPESPPPQRSKSENVFSRLTQSSSPAHKARNKGSINPVHQKVQSTKTPLVCSFVAEGHSKAVLSVQATEELLFSGSKDRTVKIWKLDTAQEMATLSGHPNNVTAVQYCESLQLVFSVSTAYIRVWDIRDTTRSIKTLSSSGLLLDNAAGSSLSRTLTLPQGENPISAIAINQLSTKLYAASGNIVRVWDLNSFNTTCKLSGGPSAAVMCVAVSSEVFRDIDLVLAGSKDHYVKIYEVPSTASGCLTARANLEPPHYDGVQSMVTDGRILFSGSRDNSIKKWNIIQKNQEKSMTSAHKDWICALSFLPRQETLISGCRRGYIKLWNVEDCSLIGEMKAHTSPINSIATNSSHIFTASSDRTVSVWRPQVGLEPRRDSPV